MNSVIHLCYAKIDFKCPHCGHTHVDMDEAYLDRINKNKRGYTWTHCHSCGERFGIACDMKGDLQSFELTKRDKK